MPTFRATDPDGVTTEYTAATPNPSHFATGWRLEELVDVAPPSDTPADTPVDTRVYGGRRTLSRLEFLALFSGGERVAIRQARGANPVLDDYLYMLEIADGVNLDSETTQSGLAMLEQAGILATGRAAEVLNG